MTYGRRTQRAGLARALLCQARVPSSIVSPAVTADIMRVLIVDDESALLFALSDYLTFRGWRVDCAEGMADARALVHHLHYDAVVVGVSVLNVANARALALETRRRFPLARLVALAVDTASPSDLGGDLIEFDQVFARHLPIVQLSRVLCRCIAA